MSLLQELVERVEAIFSTKWAVRQGRKAPVPGDVKLAGDAVSLYGAVLYADIANSTEMVESLSDTGSAEIYQAFAYCCCRAIRRLDGAVTSFDGDRVMGVFVGRDCEIAATSAAFLINGAVLHLINPAIASAYRDSSVTIRHAVGVDASDLLVVPTGMREFNDLVWVGRAANCAAKMAGLREYSTYVTKRVHQAVVAVAPGWTAVEWPEGGMRIYGSDDLLEL